MLKLCSTVVTNSGINSIREYWQLDHLDTPIAPPTEVDDFTMPATGEAELLDDGTLTFTFVNDDGIKLMITDKAVTNV